MDGWFDGWMDVTKVSKVRFLTGLLRIPSCRQNTASLTNLETSLICISLSSCLLYTVNKMN